MLKQLFSEYLKLKCQLSQSPMITIPMRLSKHSQLRDWLVFCSNFGKGAALLEQKKGKEGHKLKSTTFRSIWMPSLRMCIVSNIGRKRRTHQGFIKLTKLCVDWPGMMF